MSRKRCLLDGSFIVILYLMLPKRKWLGVVILTLGLSGVLVLLFGQLVPQYLGWIPTTTWTPSTLLVGIVGLAGLGIWLTIGAIRLASSIQNSSGKEGKT